MRMSSGSIRAGSNFSCSTEWPARSSARWSRWVIACANIVRSANCSPACPISCRRLLENTSNEGFLRAKFSDNISAEQLLRDPNDLSQRGLHSDAPRSTSSAMALDSIRLPAILTRTAPLVNFVSRRDPGTNANRAARTAQSFGRKYPLVDRRRKNLDRQTGRFDQSELAEPNRRRGRGSWNSGSGARGRSRTRSIRALEPNARWKNALPACSNASRRSWSAAASNFPRSKFSKSANRGPKPMATSARRWISASSTRSRCACSAGPRLTQHVPGEESYQHYWPRGVALVIAPWNFPIAILTGMTSAALVTGNTVIMKPAEQSLCHRRDA